MVDVAITTDKRLRINEAPRIRDMVDGKGSTESPVGLESGAGAAGTRVNAEGARRHRREAAQQRPAGVDRSRRVSHPRWRSPGRLAYPRIQGPVLPAAVRGAASAARSSVLDRA